MIQPSLFKHPLVLSAGLGVCYTLGFAPIHWWPVGLLALAGLCWLVRHSTSPKHAFYLAWVFGFSHFVTSLYWIPRSFYIDSGAWLPVFYAGIPLVLALCAFLALYLALPCYILRKIRPNCWFFPLILALIWLGFELIRTWPTFGFPWHLSGYLFANQLTFLQVASLGGVWGLSLLTLTCAGYLSHRRSWPLAMIILAAAYGFGARTLADAGPTEFTDTKLRLVQANISTAHRWNPDKRRQFLYDHVALTTQPGLAEVTTVIWPEVAVAFKLDQNHRLQQDLASILAPHQSLITGYTKFTHTQEQTQYFNSMGQLSANGTLTGDYQKHLLVPFGEALPFGLEKITRTLAYHRNEYTAGTGLAVLPLTDTLTALPLICYESIFSHYVAHNRHKQNFILNITNDNWFDHTWGPTQHAAMARMRAVETGLPLVRVANTGLTYVVDGYGRYVASIPPQQPGILDVALPTTTRKKPLYITFVEHFHPQRW